MTLPVNPTPNIGLSRPNFDVATWHDAINDNFTLLDTLLAAIGVPAVDGTWQNNTAYVIGNRLYDANDASIWICGFAHTSAVSGTFADERVAHPDYWSAVDTGFSVRGAWISGGTTYRTGDVVYDNSEYVVALAVDDHDSTTDIRTDATAGHWVFIADLKSAVTSATAAAVAAADSASDAAAIVGGDIASIIHGSSEKNPLDDADEIAIWNSVGAIIGKITKAHLFTQIASSLSIAWSTITSTPTTITGYGITDAYTKTEVDSAIATTAANVGKRSRVRVATTANITIATGLVAGQVIDGVTLATDDLVLAKNQSTASQNGIYVVGATPARFSEFDTYDEHPGSLIGVEEGTTNADTLWLCTSNTGGTLGSTAIAFTKLVIAGELLAGNNLSDVLNAATSLSNLGGMPLAGGKTVTGGFKLTPNNLGNITSFTIDPTLGNYQYGTNHGAATWTAPTSDCAVDILVTNDATAGAITFSGFTVGSSTGSTLDTVNGHMFIISIRCIHSIATYSVYALQ